MNSQEAKEKIEVVVEYEPEVSVEEMFIHAKDGDTVELVCVVHARPKADVRYVNDSGSRISGTGVIFSAFWGFTI